MKQLFSFMISILLIGVWISPDVMANNDTKKVYISTTTKRNKSNRNLSSDIKVYYIPDENLLELTCYETKETTVYVLTSTGEELSCDTFNSDMTPFYTIDAPDTPGTYWIVIDSPVIYGEGSFVVE